MKDDLLEQTVRALFQDLCTPEALEGAETTGWAAEMWISVSRLGLPWISLPEASGGEGGSLADALRVLRCAGEYGLPLPLAETGVLAGWLQASAGLDIPRWPATLLPSRGLRRDGGRISGVVRRVAWGRAVPLLVALIDREVVILDASSAHTIKEANLAGEPADTVHLDAATPVASSPAPDGVDDEMLHLRGCLTRVVLMAGAMQRVLDITIRYVGERQQFGRPIGRFQAVQQHVVLLAQQVAMTRMAADQATDSLEAGDDRARARFAILSAKSIADEGAAIGAAAAHQAHGAMGMAREYPLHYATRRLWAWSRQWGTGSQVATAIGRQVIDAGVDALWPQLSR